MVISFTPLQLIGTIVAVCGAIVTIASAVTVSLSGVHKVREPERIQNERINKLEEKMDDIERHFLRDDAKLKNLEDGNRVTQEALLALLSHGIDGNAIEGLKSAKKHLQSYLINKETNYEDT